MRRCASVLVRDDLLGAEGSLAVEPHGHREVEELQDQLEQA